MRELEFSAAIGDWSMALPHPRFGIYRNNVASALAGALRVRHPVTEQLVGSEFFAAMAGAFARLTRPASPVLIFYGAEFPDFIRAFPPAAGLPYLGDVAALEGLWWHAYHAADAALADHTAFTSIAAECWGAATFQFHPSLGLMSSSFAIGSIWQAHHGGPPMDRVDVNGAETVLVARSGMEVAMRIIPAASRDFIDSLRQGARLGDAVEQVARQHPDFDLTAQLQGLISLNIITGMSI